MTKSEYLETLMNLKKIFSVKQQEKEVGNELNQFIANIPDEVSKLIHSNISISHEIFLGCSAISYEEILNQYKDKSIKYSFFENWKVNDNFDVGGSTFSMEENLIGFLTDPVEIKNVRSMLPLFEFESNFIIYNLETDSAFDGLIFISQEGFGSMLAPDLLSYIDDLIDGLESDIYFINDEGSPVFPSSWHYKKKLKAGLVSMDEYGEIIDPDEDMNVTNDTEYPSFVKKWLQKWNNN